MTACGEDIHVGDIYRRMLDGYVLEVKGIIRQEVHYIRVGSNYNGSMSLKGLKMELKYGWIQTEWGEEEEII